MSQGPVEAKKEIEPSLIFQIGEIDVFYYTNK